MSKTMPKQRRRKVTIGYQESANIVDCPRRIQRRMRHNMREAARCNVNLRLQQRARQLLSAIEAEPKNAGSKDDGKATAARTAVGLVRPAHCTTESAVPKAPQLAASRFKQYVQRGLDFVRRKLPFRDSNSRRGRQPPQATCRAIGSHRPLAAAS